MSAPRPGESPLDASVRIDNLPPEGRDIEVRASESQLLAIAERLKISALDRLEARLNLTRFRGGLRVHGRIHAATVQPCVITFVPVPQTIEEEFDRIYLPAGEQPKAAPTHQEVFVDLDGDDAPEYFEGHEVDLAEAIVETVALALDPYPRAEGASIEELGLPDDGAEISPFAGLKSLLDPDDKG
jgi:uncharacterized metal-binding protein YceD (DUF177 family)